MVRWDDHEERGEAVPKGREWSVHHVLELRREAENKRQDVGDVGYPTLRHSPTPHAARVATAATANADASAAATAAVTVTATVTLTLTATATAADGRYTYGDSREPVGGAGAGTDNDAFRPPRAVSIPVGAVASTEPPAAVARRARRDDYGGVVCILVI